MDSLIVNHQYVIATDLDGILLRTDGTISSYTRKTLQLAQKADIKVVLVTARPPRTLRVMARHLGLTGVAICCNGAVIYDLQTDQILKHSPLEAEVAQRLIRRLREVASDTCFAFEIGLQYCWEPGYAKLNPLVRQQGGREVNAADLYDQALTKLIVRHPHLDVEVLLKLAHELAGADATVTHSGAAFVETSASGIHKAAALESLCLELGVDSSRVIAFGDMPNDLPMLRWAGYSVAVANAHPKVLQEVAEVTLSNDEDGVAIVLERVIDPNPINRLAVRKDVNDD